MTQSEDSLWTSNFGLWNNPVGDSNVGDIWNGNAQMHTGSALPGFQKINGLTSFIGKDTEKPTDSGKFPDAVDLLASWSPMNSIFQDVEKNSIWSTNDMYATEDNPSLSNSSLPWSTAPQDANREIGDSNTPNEAWELPQNTIFFGIPELDQPEPWKFEQPLVNTDAIQTTSTAVNFEPCSINCSAPTAITETSVDCGPSVTSRSESNASDNSSVKNNTSEDSAKTSAFSTEQLCDHLINSNEGWGKRPVDQSTPWDVSDMARPGADQVGRSGITTPTPGSCSTSTVVGNFRATSQIQHLESNVWTSEPPTGTGIWEMHYENNGPRSSMWPVSTSSNSVPTTQSTQPSSLMLMNNMRTTSQNGNIFQRPGAYRNWDTNDKLWNTGCPPPTGATGRPLLGGTRNNIPAHTPAEESNWNSEGNFCMLSSPSNFDAGGSCNSWETVSGNATGVQWNSALTTGSSNFSVPPFGPPNSDELRRQLPISACNPSVNDRMLVHSFSNTYRADLVKYLMSQGFKKEDVQAALIDSNMEPERALHELRERYNLSRSFGMVNQPVKNNFHGAGGNLSQFTGNGTFPGSAGSLATNGVPLPNSNNFTRNKLLGPNVTSASTQLMSLSPHPNPQLIRQQLTQQVRSALNLSVPTPLSGPLGNATSSGVSAGNSLLGQPPPPLLNASNLLSAHVSGLNQPITGSTSSSFAPGHNRASGNHTVFSNNTPNSSLPNGGLNSQNKKYARQAALFSAIQELQKKRRTIEQQVCMYKNNPAMSSQPQCADVFAELQGQLQQIDTQLRTKMAQLNLASAQDSSTTAIRGQSTTNPVDGFPIASQSRVPQDQLVQQLMEMQLKPGRLGSPEAADADFPTIGTWTPHTKPNTEHQEKLLQESIGPKTLTSTRNAVGTGESPNNTNWIGGWSSNGNAPNTGVNTARSGLSNISNWQIGPRAFPSTLEGSMTGGTKAEPPQPQQQQQPQPQLSSQPQQSGSQNTGQWLLIHSTPRHHQGSMDLNHLHMLLSQFGLTNFHLLNSFTGLVLVRIQSSELSLRLMYNLADRFTIEAISEPEALSHLQQLNVRLRSDNRTSGQFSPLGEMGGLSTGIASSSSKWVTSDPPSASGFNAVSINSRKPSAHNARLGVMVSGIH